MSGLIWALSAPIINLGLSNIPKEQSIQWVAAGLLLSMCAGLLVLSPSLFIIDQEIPLNKYLIISGIFTFPLATGTYYLAGKAFSQRTEFASLFSKVKPLVSFLLAVVVLKEVITYNLIVSAVLITIGTSILFIGVKMKALDPYGVLLGLTTSILWAFGELFMKLGIQGSHPLHSTWVALFFGTLLFGIVSFPFIANTLKNKQFLNILWPFSIHGVLSFGVAYSLFFYSIDLIGLGRTVLINAFWPALSVFITSGIRLYQGKEISIPLVLILATVFLFAGSLLQVLSIH